MNTCKTFALLYNFSVELLKKEGKKMEIKNLYFSYENRGEWLIDDLSFRINKGMFLTVLGENGSAKSTLIRLMLGLLKPTEGKVINKFRNIGYVPQKKENFNMTFPITVREMIWVHTGTTNGNTMTPEEALKAVGMENFSNQLFGSLSGGQQQRVLIARALSSCPDLLILDEPLTGIDRTSREVLRNLLEERNREGLTIISIEHDVAYALHNSTHILTMREGHGKFYTTEEYMEKISHEDMDNYLYHMKEHGHV